MADLFISYSRKDIAFARLLHKALKEHDLETWVDWQDIPPSTEWLKEVYTAIEAAHTFIFLLSDSSVLSEVCSLEIEHARKNNKRIIPIVINEVEPSKIHPALATINWIFSRSNDELQPAIASLIEAIQTDYEWVRAHTRLLVRALEWERAGKDKSFLLQGTDLQQAEDWLTVAPGKKPEPSLLQTSYIQSSRQEAVMRQRNLLVGVGVALVATVVLGVLALINSQRAVEQRGIAEEQRGIAEEQKEVAVEQATLARVRELTAVSQLPGTRFDIALLLGAETYNAIDTYQTRSNLLRLTQQNPQVIRVIAHEGVWKISLSPDGKTLASISTNSEPIRLWDVDNGQPQGALVWTGSEVSSDDTAPASIAFSPDGKTLACGYFNGYIALWDVASGQIYQKVQPENLGSVVNIAFSPDGKIIATGGTERTIILWNSASMQPIGQPLEGFYTEGEQNIVFDPNSNILAYTGGENNQSTIILWDIDSGQIIGDLQPGNGFIHTLDFHPEGNIIVSAGEGNRIIFWDIVALQPVLEIEREEVPGILSIAFSPDGKTLAAASRNRTIKTYDASSGQRIGEALSVHSGEVTNAMYHPQGDILVSCSLDDTIIFWDTNSETFNSGQLMGDYAWSREINVSFSPDGKTLACGHENEIMLWDLTSRQPLRESLRGHTDLVFGVAFSPDGKTLASADVNGTLILWDVASKKPRVGPWLAGVTDQVGPLITNQYQATNNLAFSPDGKVLAHVSGYENRVITFWDTTTGMQLGDSIMKDHCRFVVALAFSPDGRLLAAGGECETMLLDVATRKIITLLSAGQMGWVNSLAFSPDGVIMASGGDSANIVLWDIASKQPLGDPLREHQSTVHNLAFSPNGTLLASASFDGAVILWDVASRMPLGEPLSMATRSGWWVAMTAFSPDGKSLIVLHEDGSLSSFDIDVVGWHHHTCERATRNFTQEEWEFYFPGEPYRITCPQ